VDAWNAWRLKNEIRNPNLTQADLTGADLTEAYLSGACLAFANLSKAKLTHARLVSADLTGANLTHARLVDADLTRADLTKVDLAGADLTRADLAGANLAGANLTDATNLKYAILGNTVFWDVALTEVKSLDHCQHVGPSIIDFWTLRNSGPLPIAFLRGVGLPDNLLEYLPSLLNEAIQYYSCFISYSSKDQDFAERLHAELQNKGVRCWFAPHDMRIGDKIIDAIDEAIRLRDKVLLILSESAIASDWVEGEVTRALDEERKRNNVVLFRCE